MTFDAENPFALRSTLPYELPPFAKIRDEHYLPAFYAGCEEQLAEVDAILASGAATFENTIVALERSGKLLERMLFVFFNKSSSDTSDALDAIQAEIAPKLSAHSDTIRLNPALFGRIQALHERKDSLGLDEESAWLLERYYQDFIQAGAHLTEAQRTELMQLNEELSKLETQFEQNLLADTNDLAVVVDSAAELDGLSENQIAAAAAAAADRDLDGKWLIPMVNFTGHPLLESLTNRQLRQRIVDASLSKGLRGNEHDNRQLVLDITKLRARRAKLFGAANHAEYVLMDRTAEKPSNVHAMLRQIAPAAVRNARREGADLQEAIKADGKDFELSAADWDLYTERVRAEKYNIDTTEFKPYFELNRVLNDGVFWLPRSCSASPSPHAQTCLPITQRRASGRYSTRMARRWHSSSATSTLATPSAVEPG